MKKTAIFAFMVCVAQILIPIPPERVQQSLFVYRLQRNATRSHCSLTTHAKYDKYGRIIGYKTLKWDQNLGRYTTLVETTCRPMVVRQRN